MLGHGGEAGGSGSSKVQAILDEEEKVAEVVGEEQGNGLLLKQKGEQLACNRCATQGFDCQVTHGIFLFLIFC